MQRERLSERDEREVDCATVIRITMITPLIGTNHRGTMKQCVECLETLDESCFDYRGGGRNGLQTSCKKCNRERARNYRQKMRDLVGRWKLRKCCQECGFKPKHSCQLDLDHIDPSTKTYKGDHKSFDAGWSKVRIKAELAKCRVLCKNCHALRTYEQGHWKTKATDRSYATVQRTDLTITQESV